jgi:hypothetical protein
MHVTGQNNSARTKQIHRAGLSRLTGATSLKTAIVRWSTLAGIATCSLAMGQNIQAPPAITPPAGNVLFMTAHATGTQNYICQPSTSGDGTTWVFFSPQATLSIPLLAHFDQQVITHFLSPIPETTSSPEASCTLSTETNEVSCPTWQSSLDSSAVWGGKIGSINAGTDPICPNTGSIPCLLLNAVATKRGEGTPGDSGILTKTTYVQRLNTNGGSAPTASCKVGDQALVPYTADYSFYTAARRASHHDNQ